MNFTEFAAKALVLKPAGVAVPEGRLCASPAEAREAFAEIGPCVVKAQVPAGKRGKAGGILPADSAEAAGAAAETILAMSIGGHQVEHVLVEGRADVRREFYLAVVPDAAARCPAIMFSTAGGVDVEEIAADQPGSLVQRPVGLDEAFGPAEARALLAPLGLGAAEGALADILVKVHGAFRACDGELLEINPLAELADGSIVALDCKFTLDDAAAARQPELAAAAAPEPLSARERTGSQAGVTYIELDGNIGVLANGAGLTMTTMDAIAHFGGRPANFTEIGGEAYTKAEAALALVLSKPGIRSLVVNFCGAFARTDVMAEGVVAAWETLKPTVPVFFSIHGTGEEEAVRLVRERLQLEPFDLMEDAVKAAVEAAR